MAVKGRLRFEILRRDGHTCRYCGQSAPEVKLTVDHVVPEALGGKDEPSNLVTACTACNAGKASIAPDSQLVADVAADAIRYSRALDVAIRERMNRRNALQSDIDMFDDCWSDWGRGDGDDRKPVERSADWANTVERWLVGGVSVEELIDKIPLAMTPKIKAGNEWTYFCGIGWNMLTELQERARELADFATDEDAEPLRPGLLVGWTCELCGAADLPSICLPCAHDQIVLSVRRAQERAERGTD